VAAGVRPYPSQWERHIVLGNGWRIFVRPIKSDDEDLIRDHLTHVSHQFISGLIDLDYARAIAFVAIDEATKEPLGVVRLHADTPHETGEYAILLRSDLKGRGLGWSLMQLIIEYAKAEGLKRISGQILQDNTVMLKMCRELGFEIKTDPQDRGLRDVTLTLESR
jgi:RimJ/RimL family protein N-acetyltransferase